MCSRACAPARVFSTTTSRPQRLLCSYRARAPTQIATEGRQGLLRSCVPRCSTPWGMRVGAQGPHQGGRSESVQALWSWHHARRVSTCPEDERDASAAMHALLCKG